MNKKVLGLVFSPRNLGNGEMLLKEFLLAGEQWESEIINVNRLNIKPCKACYRCLPAGVSCPQEDDFALLLEKMEKADGVVVASPCYVLGPNSVLKRFMDRLLSVASDPEKFAGKPCITITTYGIPGWEGFGQEFSNLFARFVSLDLKDSFLVKASYPGEFFKDEKVLKKIKASAANFFNDNYQRKTEPFSCPVCWNNYLSFQEDNSVWCPICGGKGKVIIEEGKLSFCFKEEDPPRFSVDGMRHHFREVLPATVKEFISKREEIKEIQKKYR